MKKVIIDGNRVRRVSGQRRTILTARNVIGFAGIAAFVVWVIGLVTGGG